MSARRVVQDPHRVVAVSATDRATRETFAREYLARVGDLLREMETESVAELMLLLHETREAGKTLFVAGNGGSAATASHVACDLTRTITKGGKAPLRTVALSDNVPMITALANDVGYDETFSGQLRSLGARDDVLLVISASGNSPNILKAIACAKSMQLKTAGFFGMGGGSGASQVDVAVVVPSNEYGPVEDAHMVLNHLITAFLARF